MGVKIDTNFSWQFKVNKLSIKLNIANALLFRMRKYVSFKILISIYIVIFDLSYCSIPWAQDFSTIQRILILQKRAVKELLIFYQEIPYQSPILSPSVFNT